MKKLLSLVLACIICLAAITSAAFADTVSADELFGVITDAEGNVVEYLKMPRGDTYVNSIYVIPGGGSMTTFQYTTTQSFLFGLATTDVDTETYITEPYRTFEVSIELSDTLGGGNRVPFNKNITKYSTDGPGYTSKGTSIMYNVDDDYRDYCNGKIVNKSSGSATIRIIVVRNFDINDVIDLWG